MSSALTSFHANIHKLLELCKRSACMSLLYKRMICCRDSFQTILPMPHIVAHTPVCTFVLSLVRRHDRDPVFFCRAEPVPGAGDDGRPEAG